MNFDDGETIICPECGADRTSNVDSFFGSPFEDHKPYCSIGKRERAEAEEKERRQAAEPNVRSVDVQEARRRAMGLWRAAGFDAGPACSHCGGSGVEPKKRKGRK